jgi:MFS family permease
VGFGFILLSYTHTLAMFYASFVLISFGASGCTSVVTMTAVANWFQKKIGIALGIMGSGIGAGGFIVFLIVRLIDLYQWRSTLIILGFGMLVLGIPLSFAIRNRPEDYGFLPDGQILNPPVQTSETRVKNVEIGFKEALKMRAFLILSIAEAIRQLTIHAVIFHVMPYLSSIGVSRATGGMVAGAVPIIGIVGRFGFGWLSDFIDKRRVLAATFLLIALGVLAFGHAYLGGWLIFLFLIFFPLGHGGAMVVRGAIVREYFGKSSFGKMMGVMMGSGAIGGIIGPTLAGWAFDVYGSYHLIWLLLFGLCCLATVSVLRIKKVSSH